MSNCSSLFFCCCDKTPWRKVTWEGKKKGFVFILQQLDYTTSQREVRAGNQSRIFIQKPQRPLFTASVSSYAQLRPYIALPRQSPLKTHSTVVAKGQPEPGWFSLCLTDSGLFQVDNKNYPWHWYMVII